LVLPGWPPRLRLGLVSSVPPYSKLGFAHVCPGTTGELSFWSGGSGGIPAAGYSKLDFARIFPGGVSDGAKAMIAT